MKEVVVIGAGSFGIAVSKLLAHNVHVRVFTRNPETLRKINVDHQMFNVALSERIVATNSMEEAIRSSKLIFPIVPSDSFTDMIREAAPYLSPAHVLIHGTKGFVLKDITVEDLGKTDLRKEKVLTISELIRQQTSVVRIGCLSGPNLAKEILDGQPTATVIASEFDEVVRVGTEVLSSKKFFVFGSNDLKGAQIAGALKNIIAIGSGILDGLGLGKNIQAILITRGLGEIIHFGQSMGAGSSAFLGTAGIGDLIATATSTDSRNYQFGKRLGRGEKITTVLNTSEELAEGARTLKIVYHLLKSYRMRSPIIEILYRAVYEEYDIQEGINFLMRYPVKKDVDFIEEDLT